MYRNPLHFFTLTMKYQRESKNKKQTKKAIPFKIASKNKILKHKPDQGSERLIC